MKLINRVVLYYREGSSDKIYEVDLCQLDRSRYVVNFRYGRRGSTLKEGTKTVGAVAKAEAERVFNDLVDSKVKKGYKTELSTKSTPAKSETAVPIANVPTVADPRHQVILNRLANNNTASRSIIDIVFRRGSQKEKWPLERVIWRAGQLKIKEAAPFLINLLNAGTELRDYSIAWALGWCGDEKAIPVLAKLYRDVSTTDSVRRIAGEALLKLSDKETKREFQADMIEKLPTSLQLLAKNGPAEDFTVALQDYLDKKKHPSDLAVLETIYQIDNQHVRPALLKVLRTVPLQPNYFQRIRHIFKAAEYRRDGEVFGLIAYRFEKEKQMFSDAYWDRRYIHILSNEGHYETVEKSSIKSPMSKIAYGERTRNYLRRRVWRTLNSLGQEKDTDYVRLAVGVLLPFTDEDSGQSQTPGSRQVSYRHTFGSYWAFSNILYRNSPHHKHIAMKWDSKKSSQQTKIREEAFPELWERLPVGLLHLLSENNCELVHNFAVRALEFCKDFVGQLDISSILMLLSRPYDVTAKFGFELVKREYKDISPNRELVLATANCRLQEARAQAFAWIEAGRQYFVQDISFTVGLISSSYQDTRAFAKRLLAASVFSESLSKTVTQALLDYLLGLKEGDEEMARDISEMILKSFAAEVRGLEKEKLLALVSHPLCEVQELGGQIIYFEPDRLSGDLFEILIASKYAVVRVLAVRLLNQLPDSTFTTYPELLVSLLAHDFSDVRQAAKPLLEKLSAADKHREFVVAVMKKLLEILISTEKSHEVELSIAKLFKELFLLPNHISLTEISKDVAIELIKADSSISQEVGGLLIKAKVDEWAESFTTGEIIKLSNNDILENRLAAREVFAKVAHRFSSETDSSQKELAKAVALLDSKWEDSRKHWFEVFRSFSQEVFTPAIVIAICDSVREDVQQFGREMIVRHFQEENGQEYLLKLSEHPSTDLQLFVTNYLEAYALNSPARLQHLKYYFISVLSRINKGRVAKTRVFRFLEMEAMKNQQAAEIVAEIVAWQSATMTISDKATAIEIMVKIANTYPHITLPISIQKPEVRHAV